MTAYHDGFETICTVRLWLCNVFESPDFSSRSKLKFLVAGPRIGSGSDSVTERPPHEHRQQALLAVGDAARRADRLVADRPARHVGHRQLPGETVRFLGGQVEALVGGRIAAGT